MKFEPSGMTNDPDIRFASSLLDYVFRRLALDYLPEETREGLGIRSIAERTDRGQAELEAKTTRRARAPAGEAPGRVAAADRGRRGRSREERSTLRSATRAARRCSRRARATCARAAAAPAAAPRLSGGGAPVGYCARHDRESESGLVGLHHVQLAMPPGEEDAAARFYGAILGLERIAKPDQLSPRGRRVVPQGDLEVHLGVEETSFTPAHKAHPAFLVRGSRPARTHRGRRLPGHGHGRDGGLPPGLRARPVRQPHRADRAGLSVDAFSVEGLHHVQLACRPGASRGGGFYAGSLGFDVVPEPGSPAARGGRWIPVGHAGGASGDRGGFGARQGAPGAGSAASAARRRVGRDLASRTTPSSTVDDRCSARPVRQPARCLTWSVGADGLPFERARSGRRPAHRGARIRAGTPCGSTRLARASTRGVRRRARPRSPRRARARLVRALAEADGEVVGHVQLSPGIGRRGTLPSLDPSAAHRRAG